LFSVLNSSENKIMVISTGILILGLLLFITWAIYASLIGLFTCGWYRTISNDNTNTNNKRGVSVVIAAKNEENHILDLLNDLLLQEYPAELLEIIVVDDHSTDKTVEKVNEFISQEEGGWLRVIKFDDPHLAGKKAAITIGVKEAAGEIILTTDGDCRLGKSWISSMVASFQDERQMVFGPVSYLSKHGLMNKFQSLEFLGLVASGAGAALAGRPFICNGANLAYRKDAFIRVKGFEGNENFISGDDVFLLHKMKREFGRKAIAFSLDKNSQVMTSPVEGFAAFIDQRVRWASKSKGYNDLLSIMTSIIVFSYSLTVLLSLIATIFNPMLFCFFGGLIILKMITDLPLMIGITGFTGQRNLMGWYLPLQVVYPVYIVIVGVVSLFGRRKW